MINDLQPPSPSLSPNSKTKFYQEQLDQAHKIIDQLEILLQEKENQQRIHQTTYKNVKIPTLQLNTRLTEILDKKSQSYRTIPLQYSTPRDRTTRTRLSLGDQTSSRLIEEMKNRHSELIIQSKEENIQREQKNKELNDQIQELKQELILFQEKQSITKKEKKQIQQKLEIVENQIQSIQMQLVLSKQRGNNLQNNITEINQTNDILKVEEENNKVQQQYNQNLEQLLKEKEISNSQMQQKFQNKDNHKNLLGSLQKEIKQLENKKQEYYNLTTTTQFEEKQIQCKEYQFNYYENFINDIPQNQNFVQTSVSGTILNTFDDINSIKSIRSLENRKNRSCESCQIF